MSAAALRRILYVEDEDDIRTIASTALTLVGGFEVRSCGSGQEALGAGEAFGPDLILLDVMMPGMDGVATMEALRAVPRLSGVPVVFMTARTQARDLDAYRSLGVSDVIHKPFEPLALADQVKAIWERGHGR